MDFLGSHNKPTGGNDNDPKKHDQHGHHRPSSTDELLSSAKLVAEAAKSSFGHESDKVDKGKVAGAAANLLDAASHYGKLEEKSFGKYVENAEDYLQRYHTSHTSTTTAAIAHGHGHSDSAPPSLPAVTTHSTPSLEGGGGGHASHTASSHEGRHGDSDGDAHSGNKYGEYFKMAEGFLKKH